SLVVVLAVGIAFSLSRGGIVAMCVGLGALYWLRRRATSRKPVLAGAAVLIVAVGGLLIWVGGLESVQARLNSLSDVTRVAAGRLAHWHDALGAVRDFPLLGTGLGTYRYANLPYQIHEGAAWHVNADNHYLEQLVETGVVGLLLYGFGFIATGIAARFLCRQTDSALSTAGAVGMYAVTAQAVQAVTDFGLLIPANALTFAVLIGSVCGMACAASDFHQLRAPLWLSLGRLEGRWSIAGLSLVLALAAAAFGLEMFLSTQAATARNAAVEVDVRRPLETRIEQFDVAIEQVERALRYRPDDPELRRSAALSWINRYRVAAAHELAPSLDQLAGKPLQGRRLWQATSLRILAARAAEFRKTGDVGQLRRIQQLPLIRDNLAPAREHLLEAFRHGPLTRDVSLLLANLTLLIETERNWQQPAETWLARGLFILPSSPDDLFAGAVVADLAGLTDSADRAYRRCLTVSPGHVLTVWSTLSKNRPISELLQGPIPARLDVLIPLAEHVSDDLTKGTLAIRAARLLNEENWEDPSGPTEGLRARLAELQGEPEVAISYYRSVLETDPRDEETRLRLAQLLIREERLPEAETELSLLHGLAPHRKDVLRQIEKLKQQRLHEASTTAN
ncbi:MAG: O-antigen ligase family protein, partial [Planctomycetaceae bacterium]|nr:O-antigen ligase family protein [Planctomycetaceae bacterium]